MKVDQRPIFVLAQTPRCGSTWVQRLLTSTGDVLIWGEGEELLLGDMWTKPKEENNEYPENTIHELRRNRSNMWMAVLRPFLQDSFSAKKVYLDRLFGVTAHKEGYSRWGVKSTEWDANGVLFMRQKYPECRIIMLARRFDESFASLFKNKEARKYVAGQKTDLGEMRKFCEQWILHTSLMGLYKNDPHVLIRWHHDLVADNNFLAYQLCRELKLSKPPAQEVERKISAHSWAEDIDLITKSPNQLDAIWVYRDKMLEIAKLWPDAGVTI